MTEINTKEIKTIAILGGTGKVGILVHSIARGNLKPMTSDTADAPLCPDRVRLLRFALGQKRDPAVRRRPQREAQTRDAGADDDEIIFAHEESEPLVDANGTLI